MDHVYTVFVLIVPCSVLCGHIPAPVNLTIDSHHFVHLLKWQAGPGSPAGLRYRVTVCSYLNKDWKTVDSCRAVHFPLRCNLTEVFSNLDDLYFVNVSAVLGNETSTPCSYPAFRPVSDTVLELPSLQVLPCNESLCVHLHPSSERLAAVYKNFDYMLQIFNEKGSQFSRKTKGLDTVVLEVIPGLRYCVSVNIEDRHFAEKPPVCASIPTAVNSMDAVITVILCLLVLMIVVIGGLLVLKRSIYPKSNQPSVLSSFKVPYKVQLFPWPTVESLNCISLEPNKYEEVQVNEELDQEKEDEEVTYERRKGCEDVVCGEEILEDPNSSLIVITEIQHEHTLCPVRSETYGNVAGTLLAPDMIKLHLKATTLPQTPSQIITTHLLAIKTPIQELKNNDLALLRHKKGEELSQEQEDEEDNDNVNFSSLTLGGQNLEQQDETEKEEKVNVKNMKPDIPLIVLRPPKPAAEFQPKYFQSTDKHISYSNEVEDENMEEEETFTGYMMRKKPAFL